MSHKTIDLTQGHVAIVDEQDYPEVSKYKWHADRRRKAFYARARIGKTRFYLHRFLMQPTPDLTVDHLNNNPLDCRKSNMEIVTREENARREAQRIRERKLAVSDRLAA